MARYNAAKRKLLVKRTLEAVQARVDGRTKITLGTAGTRQEFNLIEGGYCNRFVRQCFETMLNIKPFSWAYRAEEAHQTLAKLAPFKVPISDRKPGDVLGCPGDPGHIAIYIGDAYGDGRDLVAENTSSAVRGYPRGAGTKISSFKAFYDQHNRQVTCYKLFDD
jgi:cell wall-associated NlpC family hydrolase